MFLCFADFTGKTENNPPRNWEESQGEVNCAPARRDQAEAHVDVVGLAAAANRWEMGEESCEEEVEGWRLEVEEKPR